MLAVAAGPGLTRNGREAGRLGISPKNKIGTRNWDHLDRLPFFSIILWNIVLQSVPSGTGGTMREPTTARPVGGQDQARICGGRPEVGT
jgi:hypothetical protein